MKRLGQLAEEEPRQFLEEHTVRERRGNFGGRSIETTADGRLRKQVFIPTCLTCGTQLEDFVMCVSCLGTLCRDCATKMNGTPYCRQHLMEILPLSRNGYKVLICIEAGIDDAEKINDITKIPKDDVKASLAFLKERKLISSSGLFAFLERKITAEGLHAISVFKRIYDEEDVRQVEEQLTEEDEDGN
jgi:hypothetical protein